jgi:hypothetical protein
MTAMQPFGYADGAMKSGGTMWKRLAAASF